MGLATRCPKCQAMFRVVADQLKLRGGLVRCGSCRHVFDAIGSLSYVDDRSASSAPQAGTSASGSAASALALSPTSAADPGGVPPTVAASAPVYTPAALRAARGEADQAALGVPTLLLTDLPSQLQVPAAEAGRAIRATTVSAASRAADAPSQPGVLQSGRGAKDVAAKQADPATGKYAVPVAGREPANERSEDSSPAFLRRKPRSRGLSMVFGSGTVLLVIVALLQLAVLFRVEVATTVPSARAALIELCKPLRCAVGWPTRADLLAVVGTELQAVPGTDILELTAVLRSRATYTLALPAVEVTLTDTQNRALARKVFAPADYLAASGEPRSRVDGGLAAGADYIVRVSFEARGLSAAGFVVYPFYF